MCWTSKQSHRRQNAENGLKDRFPSCHMQSNRCNARIWKTPKKAVHARIELIACVVFFSVHALLFQVFDCVASHASVAFCVLRMTAWKAPMKTDLKVGFQAAICNASRSYDADQKPQHMQCKHMKNTEKRNARKDRIGCVHYVFHLRAMHCVFRFFDCVTSRVSVALRVLRMTAWKPHVGLWVGLCDIQLFTFLWWISGSAVRCDVLNE